VYIYSVVLCVMTPYLVLEGNSIRHHLFDDLQCYKTLTIFNSILYLLALSHTDVLVDQPEALYEANNETPRRYFLAFH
jgi:hypothetical protein